MKPVRKRAKGAGNSNPTKRKSFPEVDQTLLEDKLDSYVRQMGKEQAFNMLEYTHLQPQQAEVPRAMAKLAKLLESLLQASPPAQIKYCALKMGLASMMNKFGSDILSAHFECEKEMLAGRGADSLTVLLKHWRRVTSSDTSFQKFQQKLDESQASIMAGLLKRMAGSEEAKKSVYAKKRFLKKEESEVTMASDGWPAMLATPADSDSAGSAAESAAESSAVGSSWADLQKSPPPVLKSNWKAAAGKHVKKPASKRSLAKGQKLKKPAAQSKSSGSSKDGARGGPDSIHLPSVKLGGGKAQSYIQHMPDGPDGSKRLIVACTAARAKFLKVTHKALMEELLPKCKENGATKTSVLKERDKLFEKYGKPP